MSIQTYQKAAAKAETPRQTEFRAFATATRGLIDAASMPRTEVSRRIEALVKNRRLWTALASDCAIEGNGLPEQLRAQIISLSLFVDRQTQSAIRENQPFDVLIEINRTVMDGLAAQQSMQPAAAPAPLLNQAS